jgi:hypothetical protein
MGGLARLISIPITFIIIGAILRAYPIILGAPVAAATVTPERAPLERLMERAPVEGIALP